MKVLVAVKRVVDHTVRIHVNADGSGVDTAHARMAMNPFDEIAVEEAVRLKEAGRADEVIAVSAGSAACSETLRSALAMGADRAILIEYETALEPLTVAKLLRAVCQRERPDLVLCGKQAIDDDAHQTGQMLSALLGWPQATCASKLVVSDAHGDTIEVTREVDDGTEGVEIRLPAVVTTDLRLNEPRYVSLPNVMKARKKPIETTSPEALGVDPAPRLARLRVSEPPARPAGVRVSSVDELVGHLKARGAIR